jgi:uncharacterized protein
MTTPLETFANAGGVHLARAVLAELAENIAGVVAEQVHPPAPNPDPFTAGKDRQRAETPPQHTQAITPAASALKGDRVLWRAFVSWLREVFFGKRDTQ